MANIDAFGGDSQVFHSTSKQHWDASGKGVSGPGPWNEAMRNTSGITTGAHHYSGSSSPMYATDIRDYGYWDPESGEPDPYNRFSSDGWFGPYDLLMPWGSGALGKAIPLIGAGIGMGLDWWRGDVSPTPRK